MKKRKRDTEREMEKTNENDEHHFNVAIQGSACHKCAHMIIIA